MAVSILVIHIEQGSTIPDHDHAMIVASDASGAIINLPLDPDQTAQVIAAVQPLVDGFVAASVG